MTNFYAYAEPPSGGTVRALEGLEDLWELEVSEKLPGALESLVGVLIVETGMKLCNNSLSEDSTDYAFYHLHRKAGQPGEWFTYKGIKRVFPNIDEILKQVKSLELIRHE